MTWHSQSSSKATAIVFGPIKALLSGRASMIGVQWHVVGNAGL